MIDPVSQRINRIQLFRTSFQPGCCSHNAADASLGRNDLLASTSFHANSNTLDAAESGFKLMDKKN
jgi:hypothetical protein